jgi:hypothetical protein
METYYSNKIQFIAIAASFVFLLYVSRLIIKGKLREEYAIFWIISTIFLIVFSFWRQGLDKLAILMGVDKAPNLVFTIAIFAILIYLLHLSIVVSKLHDKNKKMAQEIALLKNMMEKKIENESTK